MDLLRKERCVLLACNMSPLRLNRSVVARALAGVLAVSLLVFELLATSGRFHQALHSDGNSSSSTCIICLFAKGHLDTSPATPVPSPAIEPAFNFTPRVESITLVDFRYLASPPRAPPAPAPLLTVLA